eukprot:s1417_g10.t1
MHQAAFSQWISNLIGTAPVQSEHGAGVAVQSQTISRGNWSSFVDCFLHSSDMEADGTAVSSVIASFACEPGRCADHINRKELCCLNSNRCHGWAPAECRCARLTDLMQARKGYKMEKGGI